MLNQPYKNQAYKLEKRYHKTQTVFFVVIFFIISQITWWIIFQQRYVKNMTQTQLELWELDAQLANQLEPTNQELMLETYKHLQQVADNIVVSKAAISNLKKKQQGYLRMYAYEGPFFVLIVLTGLFIIYRHLQAEQKLKVQQQNFINAVSHELKTPLSSLKLILDTVLYRKLDAARTEKYLHRMHGELHRLELTSEQVLAAARLERANVPQKLEPQDLAKTVKSIVTQASPSLEVQGAEMRLELPQDNTHPLLVRLDAAALSLVLNNLLDNAVKYSPQATKPITVRVAQQEHIAIIEVEDAGIGIAEGEKERIFEKFYRAGSEMTRATQGIGLGLYLVRATIEAMNGWIRCEPLAQGTRFRITLPKYIA